MQILFYWKIFFKNIPLYVFSLLMSIW